MKKPVFTIRSITFGLVLLSVLFVSSCKHEMPTPPNFVILQLDDLGYDDLSIHGNTLVESPNIDSLGYTGMRFQQFYVNPVCAPTRASLLTGRHFMRTGVTHVHGGKDFLSLDETTFAEVLQAAGYATGMWGKWHSGHARGYFPWERGFDEAYMAELYRHRNSRGLLNGTPVEHAQWADQVITSYAIDFIDAHRKQPFLAYLSFLSVHAPLETPDTLRDKYIEKGLSYNLATIYGMVEYTDHYVGELLHAIDTMGLTENTIIMLMSDNGPAVLNNMLSDADRKIRYVSEMKGHKGNIWENGVRSPLFVKWQGVTQPIESYDLLDVTDIYPTLLELAGAAPLAGTKPLDGTSFRELLVHGNVEKHDKISYNMSHRGWPPSEQPWTPVGMLDEYRPVTQSEKNKERYGDQILSVRKGAFKLMHHPGKAEGSATPENGYVLVDILADPGEEFNLYTEMPEVAAEMELLLMDWWGSILTEPASFSMPTFAIGAAGEDVSTILAKAPAETSPGVRSAYAWLTGWSAPGTFATYHISVETPGVYEASILYQGKSSGATVELRSGNATVRGRIDTHEKTLLGTIALDKLHTDIRLQLIKNPGRGEVFERLESIELRKL